MGVASLREPNQYIINSDSDHSDESSNHSDIEYHTSSGDIEQDQSFPTDIIIKSRSLLEEGSTVWKLRDTQKVLDLVEGFLEREGAEKFKMDTSDKSLKKIAKTLEDPTYAKNLLLMGVSDFAAFRAHLPTILLHLWPQRNSSVKDRCRRCADMLCEMTELKPLAKDTFSQTGHVTPMKTRVRRRSETMTASPPGNLSSQSTTPGSVHVVTPTVELTPPQSTSATRTLSDAIITPQSHLYATAPSVLQATPATATSSYGYPSHQYEAQSLLYPTLLQSTRDTRPQNIIGKTNFLTMNFIQVNPSNYSCDIYGSPNTITIDYEKKTKEYVREAGYESGDRFDPFEDSNMGQAPKWIRWITTAVPQRFRTETPLFLSAVIMSVAPRFATHIRNFLCTAELMDQSTKIKSDWLLRCLYDNFSQPQYTLAAVSAYRNLTRNHSANESFPNYMHRLLESYSLTHTGVLTFAREQDIIKHFCETLGDDYLKCNAIQTYAELSRSSGGVLASDFASLFAKEMKHDLNRIQTNKLNYMTVEFNSMKRGASEISADFTSVKKDSHPSDCKQRSCQPCYVTIINAMTCARCCNGSHLPKRCKNPYFRPDIRCQACGEYTPAGKEHSCYVNERTYCQRCTGRSHNEHGCRELEPMYKPENFRSQGGSKFPRNNISSFRNSNNSSTSPTTSAANNSVMTDKSS